MGAKKKPVLAITFDTIVDALKHPRIYSMMGKPKNIESIIFEVAQYFVRYGFKPEIHATFKNLTASQKDRILDGLESAHNVNFEYLKFVDQRIYEERVRLMKMTVSDTVGVFIRRYDLTKKNTYRKMLADLVKEMICHYELILDTHDKDQILKIFPTIYSFFTQFIQIATLKVGRTSNFSIKLYNGDVRGYALSQIGMIIRCNLMNHDPELLAWMIDQYVEISGRNNTDFLDKDIFHKRDDYRFHFLNALHIISGEYSDEGDFFDQNIEAKEYLVNIWLLAQWQAYENSREGKQLYHPANEVAWIDGANSLVRFNMKAEQLTRSARKVTSKL